MKTNRAQKLLLVAAAATAMQLSAGYAQPLTVEGDVTLKYERVKHDSGDATENNQEHTVRLNVSQQLDERTEAFMRYGYRYFGGDNTDDNLSKLDQYGIRYKPADNTLITLGVQETTLGMYSGKLDLSDQIGQGMLKGINAQIGDGPLQYHILGGRLDKSLFADNEDKNTIGFEVIHEAGDRALSAEYLHINGLSNASNFYGLSAKQTIGKAEALAEYLRSNASSDQYGIIYGVNYAPTEKDSLALTQRYIKNNAIPEGLGAYDPNERGTELAWERKLGETSNLTLTYEISKELGSNDKDKTTTLEYSLSF